MAKKNPFGIKIVHYSSRVMAVYSSYFDFWEVYQPVKNNSFLSSDQ